MVELIETFKCKTLKAVQRFRKDERAVTAMEYGLIAALIGVVAVTTIDSIGTKVQEKFTAVLTAMSTN